MFTAWIAYNTDFFQSQVPRTKRYLLYCVKLFEMFYWPLDWYSSYCAAQLVTGTSERKYDKTERTPHSVQGDPSGGEPGFCWLGFGMFHHPAWAVGSYSSGPLAGGTPQI